MLLQVQDSVLDSWFNWEPTFASTTRTSNEWEENHAASHVRSMNFYVTVLLVLLNAQELAKYFNKVNKIKQRAACPLDAYVAFGKQTKNNKW